MLRNEKDQFQFEYTYINCGLESFKFSIEFKQGLHYSKNHVTHQVWITKILPKKTKADKSILYEESAKANPDAQGVEDFKPANDFLIYKDGGDGA